MIELMIGKVGPVFLTILIGFLLTWAKVIRREGIPLLSRIVMNAFIPAMLFQILSHSDIMAHFDLRLYGAYYTGAFLNFGLMFFLARVWLKAQKDEAAVTAMGGTFSNIVFVGIPLIQAVYGDDGLVPVLLIVSIHAFLLLGTTVLIVEISRGGEDGHWITNVKRSVIRLLRNPVIIAIVLGCAASVFHVKLPEMLDGTLARFRSAGPTVALLLVGAGLYGQSVRGNLKASMLCTVGKMFILPAIVFVMAKFVFGMPSQWVTVMTIVAAMPAGANVAIIAGNYNVCIDRSSTTILLTTLLSILTLPALVLLSAH